MSVSCQLTLSAPSLLPRELPDARGADQVAFHLSSLFSSLWASSTAPPPFSSKAFLVWKALAFSMMEAAVNTMWPCWKTWSSMKLWGRPLLSQHFLGQVPVSQAWAPLTRAEESLLPLASVKPFLPSCQAICSCAEMGES